MFPNARLLPVPPVHVAMGQSLVGPVVQRRRSAIAYVKVVLARLDDIAQARL